MNIKERKKLLRKDIKNRIEKLTEAYRREADKRIYERVVNLKEYKEAETVFLFAGTFGEPDTWPIIENALSSGKVVGLPLCINDYDMKVMKITGRDDIEPGMMGILEPKSHCEEIEPESIDFVLVPCVTCDRKGRRLGHGRGYYDRFFEKCERAFKCLVCYEELMVDEVPVDSWDVLMDVIVGEVKENDAE